MLDKETNPLFANNPFSLKGEVWKEKRAEITPAFTSNRLKALYPKIQEVEERIVKYLEKESQKKEPFDILVVPLAIFGIDAESFTKEKRDRKEIDVAEWSLYFAIVYFDCISILKTVHQTQVHDSRSGSVFR